MDFTEIHTRVCPKDQSEVTLTILYTKATCSRVSDKIQRFRCSMDSSCEDCREDYED